MAESQASQGKGYVNEEGRSADVERRETKNAQALEDSHLESCSYSFLGFLTHSQLQARTYFQLINGAETLIPEMCSKTLLCVSVISPYKEKT